MKYLSGILTTRKVSTRQRGGIAARDRLGSMKQEAEDSPSKPRAQSGAQTRNSLSFILFYFVCESALPA